VRLSMQFASHGYVVMAPEIYREHEPPGTVLGYDKVGTDKGNAYKEKTKLSTFDADAAAVIRALAEHRCQVIFIPSPISVRAWTFED
jgi:carboxymethylenebutenolidase